MTVQSFEEKMPTIGAGTYLHPSADVFGDVTIGENCWIGNCSIIMANLGRQNVIAAGSVVIKDTGNYEIHGGNPARLIEKFCDD